MNGSADFFSQIINGLTYDIKWLLNSNIFLFFQEI
jgi:hypothetical protein